MKRTVTYALVLFSGVGLLGFSLGTKASEINKNTITGSVSIDPSERITLENLQKSVPLTYNEPVEKLIKAYASQKNRFSRMLGLSKYYFPIYERVFKEKGLPEELKYLSVVESSLNPNAQSWVGATGLWQFLEPVGKIYGLTINDTLDERKDPILASAAAADYLLKSYAMYNDWLLAIASYNCGHNNIRWARENAGGADLNYWEIRKYLPVETQNYVPAFIATVFIMNNYKRYGIYPARTDLDIFTNTLTVNRKVSLWSISKATNINIDMLTLLNPSYKDLTLSGTSAAPKNLIIPEVNPYIYEALRQELLKTEPVEGNLELTYQTGPDAVPVQTYKPSPSDVTFSYIVQGNDTLSSIAKKFNSTEEKIIIINELKTNSIKPGMVLKIIQS